MTRLHEKGQITDGAFMEFLQSHTNVTHQPMFDSGQYGGFNPYALGFGIMQDISRICVDPTAEDRMWFPDIAGSGNPDAVRSEEHTSELQSLMRHTYAVFGLKQKNIS